MRARTMMSAFAAAPLCACVALSCAIQVRANPQVLRAGGILINVPRMDEALRFYVDGLGYAVAERQLVPARVVLRGKDGKSLILHVSPDVRPFANDESRPSLTLQVNDLGESMDKMRALGFLDARQAPREEGVGFAITIHDPAGTPISLMHQTIVKTPRFEEPKIYNYGFFVPDIAAERDLLVDKLGLAVRSNRFLPKDLPLDHADKSFALMLHQREGVRPSRDRSITNSPIVIFWEAPNVLEAESALKQADARARKLPPDHRELEFWLRSGIPTWVRAAKQVR
ncbi:MAG: VOC family protein [Betaproteobacteria bacterium]|nr:VOC family protein [Betaproteobacteria bacterium]